MKHLLSFFFLFLFSVSVASAASSDFTVKLKVGDDTVPPTTPANLTATPVAYTQINLAWDASTDDFLMGGYQVFRDTVQIATTTLTSYSDTGLSASTTYTYFIRAFDSVGLLSSSSNSVSTTTLELVPTSTPATATSTSTHRPGDATKILLESFTVTPSQHSAELSWETNIYAQFDLRWGRTNSYELGFVVSNFFNRGNTTLIEDLQPGTTYSYQLIAHSQSGGTFVLKEGQFKTLDAPDTQAPANVSDLRAAVDGGTVHLSWDNPTDPDFSYVRIVRNYFFYPNDPNDGYLIYQANGNFFTDKNALLKKDIQYYTVFSYDTQGNVSSGAIIAVSAPNANGSATSSPSTQQPSFSLSFSDIEIIQSDVTVDSSAIDSTKPILFRISYEKLPEHLKAITITLTDPQDPSLSFSFLLKINNDKTYYEAMVAPLKREGAYPLLLSLYDYQTQQLQNVRGSLLVHTPPKDTSPFISSVTRDITIPPVIGGVLWILLLLLLLFLLYVILIRGRDKQEAYEALGRRIVFSSIVVSFVIGGVGAYMTHAVLSDNNLKTNMRSNTATSFNALQSGFDTTSFLIGCSLFLLVLVCLLFVLFFLEKKNNSNKHF